MQAQLHPGESPLFNLGRRPTSLRTPGLLSLHMHTRLARLGPPWQLRTRSPPAMYPWVGSPVILTVPLIALLVTRWHEAYPLFATAIRLPLDMTTPRSCETLPAPPFLPPGVVSGCRFVKIERTLPQAGVGPTQSFVALRTKLTLLPSGCGLLLVPGCMTLAALMMIPLR